MKNCMQLAEEYRDNVQQMDKRRIELIEQLRHTVSYQERFVLRERIHALDAAIGDSNAAIFLMTVRLR